MRAPSDSVYPYLRYRLRVDDAYGTLLVVTRDGLRRQRRDLLDAAAAAEGPADTAPSVEHVADAAGSEPSAALLWRRRSRARVTLAELDAACPCTLYDGPTRSLLAPMRAGGDDDDAGSAQQANTTESVGIARDALPVGEGADAGGVGALDVPTCLICLEAHELQEKVRVLPRCGHMFHDACIAAWACGKKAMCPTCRAWILSETQMRHRRLAADAERVELLHAAVAEERVAHRLRAGDGTAAR